MDVIRECQRVCARGWMCVIGCVSEGGCKRVDEREWMPECV